MAKAKGTKPKLNHVFRNVRDPVVLDASQGLPTSFSITTNSSGSFNNNQTICPLGIVGYNILSAASGSSVTYTTSYIQGAKHPWLYNQARNFERYRITRYVLIFVGNVGSTATGSIMLDSSSDFADVITVQGFGASTGGKIFDLAQSAGKELRFNCDVDSSWKKVSSQVFSLTGNTLVPVSTGNDLSCTNWFVTVNGAASNTLVGSLYAEFDVEFKDPISYGVNA